MFRLPLQVRDFLSRKDIKPDSSLGERLLQYFEFTVEGGESGGDAAVTEQLPNSLLSEVILHENYALIHKVHLFNGSGPNTRSGEPSSLPLLTSRSSLYRSTCSTASRRASSTLWCSR